MASLKLFDNEKVRKGKTVNICVICGDIAHTNKYENWTCLSCTDFFVSCVKNQATPKCSKNGKCECSYIIPEKCQFCYLNKCYCFGLKSYLVEGFEMNSIETVIGIEFKRPDRNFASYQNFLKSIYIFEQQFYQWFAYLYPKYFDKPISLINKTELEQKYFKRGIIMGFIERCINVHNVIRLHDCFIEWHNPECLFMRHFFLNILRFSNSVRNFYGNHQNFYALLLKLIFKDDIHFWQCNPASDHFSNIFMEVECWFASCAEKNKIIFNEKIVDTYDFEINIFKFKKALQSPAFPMFQIILQ